MVINDDLNVCYDAFQPKLGPVYDTSIVRSHTSDAAAPSVAHDHEYALAGMLLKQCLTYCLVPRIDTLSLVTCTQSPVPLWPPSVPPALTSAAPSLKVLELVQDGLSCVLIYFLFHTPSSIPHTALSYPSHFSLHHEPNDHALPCQPWTDAVCNDVACCFTRARAACYFRTDQCSSVTAVLVRLRIPV